MSMSSRCFCIHAQHRFKDSTHMLYRNEQKLGSCIAISAALLPQQLQSLQQQQSSAVTADATPILITHGSKDSELPREDVDVTVRAAKQAGKNSSVCMQYHACSGTTHILYRYLFMCCSANTIKVMPCCSPASYYGCASYGCSASATLLL